ncbi:MAG: flippase-like domain-containing protein [Sphingobacteriales bacterium]|nr:flippase-like domain-containing protein [Sphingobacteriales bacterium]
MKKNFRTILQYLLFLGVGIFFAWLSLKNLDQEKTEQIKMAFRNARYWLALPVFFILLSSHAVRALRWRLLMEPMGYRPSRLNSFFAVMIGYLVNMGVPRLGEIVKCTVLARYEKIPADKLVGTIILERLIDSLTLLLVFGITLLIQPHLYAQIMEAFFKSGGPKEEPAVSTGLITVILLCALLLLIGLWMLIKKKSLKDLLAVFKKIWKSVIQGISTIQHLKKRKQFIGYTLLLWVLYLSGGYIGFMAFRETSLYGVREAFTILSAGSIGMIASPGGIGAYAYLIEKTMQLYGLNYTIALAFGWILWLAQTTVILLGGIISFGALPYFNKKKKHEQG